MESFVNWIVRLPPAVGFLVLMSIGLLVAIGFTLLVERAFRDDLWTRTSTSVATVVGVVAGLYAVLVAFVIVNEWQAYGNAQTQVSNESAALTTASENVSVLSEPARANLLRRRRVWFLTDTRLVKFEAMPPRPTWSRRVLEQRPPGSAQKFLRPDGLQDWSEFAPRGWHAIGRVHHVMGDLEKAIDEYERASSIADAAEALAFLREARLETPETGRPSRSPAPRRSP